MAGFLDWVVGGVKQDANDFSDLLSRLWADKVARQEDLHRMSSGGEAAPYGGGMGTVSPQFLAQAEAQVANNRAQAQSRPEWLGMNAPLLPQPMQAAQAPGPPLDLAAASQAPGQPLQLGGLPPEIMARGITLQQPQLPIPPQAAPQLTPSSPDLGDRLGAAFQSFAQTAHGPPLAALSNFIQAASTGRRTDPQGVASANREGMTRAIFSALKQSDPKMSDQQAMLIATASATDPKLSETLIPQALGLNKPKTFEEYAVAEAIKSQSLGASAQASAATSALPTTPSAWQDYQATGRAKIKAAETIAEEKAKVEANLPRSITSIDTALATIEQARNHPGRTWYTTGLFGDLPAPPNTAGRGFVALMKQLGGQVFLDAYETLKGGGQITQIEGVKATEAKARLDRAQNREDLEAAFNDLRDALTEGRRKLLEKSGRLPVDISGGEKLDLQRFGGFSMTKRGAQ
jgi:ribosomal protein S9